MPDLNSVPPSPHVLAASRQPQASSAAASASMPPPPIPNSPSSMHVFPSNQMAVGHGTATSSSLPSPYFAPTAPLAGSLPAQPGDGPGVGPGPGPLRHPRPLTVAELHMQLEKEQEAVVNRLTRELTLLRAQNASVVSNASSTSAGGGSEASAPTAGAGAGAGSSVSGPPIDAHSLLSGATGFSIPSSAGRHQRTYSNTSTRSQTAAAGSSAPSIVGITASAPVRPSAPGLSRQNSTASRRSRTNSPGPQSLSSSLPHAYAHIEAAGYFSPHRSAAAAATTAATTSAASESPALLPGTARYEETAFYRAELESVKRENEALKRRIRELERGAAAAASGAAGTGSSGSASRHGHALHQHHPHQHHSHQPSQASARMERRERRTSDVSRGRSESVSTTASMSMNSLAANNASSSSTAGPTATTTITTTTTTSTTGPVSAAAGGGAGVGIAGRRDTGRERVVSMLSVAGSVGVGVPEDEVCVGESAASAGLRAPESTT